MPDSKDVEVADFTFRLVGVVSKIRKGTKLNAKTFFVVIFSSMYEKTKSTNESGKRVAPTMESLENSKINSSDFNEFASKLHNIHKKPDAKKNAKKRLTDFFGLLMNTVKNNINSAIRQINNKTLASI